MSSNLKGRRMQMNVLRRKQVSYVGSRDYHGQPIAGGDQKCRRQVGSRSTHSDQKNELLSCILPVCSVSLYISC